MEKINKNMSIESQQELSTFVSVTGPIDKQVQKATGLAGITDVVKKMEERADVTRADLLVPNQCNQECVTCFYKRKGASSITRIDDTVSDDIEKMLEILKTVDNSPYFYPREPTAFPSLPLLSKYKEVGMDSILTNGKTLTKPGVVDALKQAGIKTLTVTVPGLADSYTAYTNEPIAQYELVLEGMGIAKDAGFEVNTFMPVFEQNIYDVMPMSKRLSALGVSKINFIRVLPVGNAKEMPDEFFLKPESVINFLKEVNKARLSYPLVKFSLFGQSFGPNFYSPGIWKTLAGQTNIWPGTKFACPAVGQKYLGVMFGTGEIVRCFEGMSLENQVIGSIENGKIILNTKDSSRSETVLRDNLRGICAKDKCEYQALCLGGCRTAAIAEATRRKEKDPEFAGQTICVTQILKRECGF